MKNIYESSKVFQAYVRIDYCYWRITQLHLELSEPVSPIINAIDVATGYNDARVKKIKSECEILLIDVIECKKLIEADATMDEKLLNQLRVLNSAPTTQESDASK